MEDNSGGEIPRIYYAWYKLSKKHDTQSTNSSTHLKQEEPPPPLPFDNDFFDGLANNVKNKK